MEIKDEDIFYINAYQNIVGELPEAVYYDNTYVFFIAKNIEAGLRRLKNLSEYLNRKVVILRYSDKLEEFISSFFNNSKVSRYDVLDVNNEKTLVLFVEPKDVKFAFGNGNSKLRAAKKIFKQLFQLDNVVIKKDIMMEVGGGRDGSQ
ncbi:MAG: hypothetical protein NZ908_02205 [Candidatus Micrarchaeota archaeon]|nr:hypothetical protein [Candidatus Micrarchaeota archaeon]MCX8154602.1 hypothetical protein [Candidatus Micrarchaeota archaeon]